MVKLKWPFLIILLSLIVIAAAVFLVGLNLDTTLEFQVVDEVSRGFVWDLTLHLQNRFINSYYQSNSGTYVFKFTRLQPGDSVLTLSAPSYTGIKVPVKLSWGRNVLAEPITMQGYEIPGLTKFYYFDKSTVNDVIIQLRPVNAEDHGIQNHPCLEILVGMQISEQVIDGIPVAEPTKTGADRGMVLFKQFMAWDWDGDPATFYRYSITIPKTEIKSSAAGYWVYDFLVVVPDPRKITHGQLVSIKNRLSQITDPGALKEFLEGYGDDIKYFMDDRWNKEALPR
ncbi:MAG: hypothetical protein JW969_16430 [Spirochaetales bacterium]|nr:hypothetical protein [Spirochaetales bacterium]